MKFRVNPKTLLFEDLEEESAKELERIALDLVLRGKVCWEHPAWTAWWTTAGLDERQALLTISTVFSIRSLLSLLYFEKGQLPRAEGYGP
jgi:hypothetical protein